MKRTAHIAMHLTVAIILLLSSGVSLWAGTTATSKKKSSSASSSRKAKSSKSGKKVSRRDRGQKAPTPERLSEIQQALAKDGSYSGSPNGHLDANTTDALKKFQAAHGLNPSGKLDAKTLQRLGLGSQTAGVAAPTPSVKVSSTTAPQSTIASPRQ